MIKRFIILSSVLFGFIALVPAVALAQSLVTDSFDTNTLSSWIGTEGYSVFNWDSNTADCYANACISGSSAVNYMYQSGSPASDSGEMVIYFREDGYDGQVNFGVCDSSTSAACGGSSGYYGAAVGGLSSGNPYNDNTWHYMYFAWQSGGTYEELCTLVDDDNAGDCSWQNSHDAAGFTYDSVLIGKINGGTGLYMDQLASTTYTPPTFNTNTRIDSVTPIPASTISSSTAATFAVTGYVNAADYTSGMTVTMSYAPYVASQEASGLPSSYYTTITFPVTSSGAFSFSTSSSATVIGNYTMQTSLQGASSVNFFGLFSFNIPFFANNYTSTSTTFIVDELNGFDVYMASSTAAIQTILNETGTSSQACNIGASFNVSGCIGYIFIPQPAVLDQQFQQFYSGVLTYAPWGYVTRFFSILASNGTTTLPSATATVYMPYSNGGASDTQSFTIDPTATLADASAALDSVDADGTDLNWQAVLEPYVQLCIAIFLLFIIVHDLIGTAHHRRKSFKQ